MRVNCMICGNEWINGKCGCNECALSDEDDYECPDPIRTRKGTIKMTEDELIYKKPCVVSYILKVGEARQMLHQLQQDEFFSTLGKHNPYWDSEHEIEADKLDEIRMNLCHMLNQIMDAYQKLGEL